MNELDLRSEQLPEKIDDLAKFVLVIPQKISSVRAEIKALTKVALAEEVLEQKRAEMQTLGELYIDASVKVGELLRKIPPRSGPQSLSSEESDKWCNDAPFEKTKGEVIADLGIEATQAKRFQMLALYPNIIAIAKEESREAKRPLTMNRVLTMIKAHRRGCLVRPEDYHHYASSKLTDGDTFDKKTKARAKRVMIADGQMLKDFLEAGDKLLCDDYHLQCLLRTDGAGKPEELLAIAKIIQEKLERLIDLLEKMCRWSMGNKIQLD